MKVGQIVVVLMLVLALGVLGFLLNRTQSQHTDGNTLSQLIALGQVDSELNSGIAQARLNLEPLQAGITRNAELLQSAPNTLGWSVTREGDLPPAVAQARQVYFTALRDKLSNFEKFAEQRATFIEQNRELQKTSEAARRAVAGSRFEPVILQLAEEVKVYTLQAAPPNRPRIVKLLAQVQSGAAQLADAMTPGVLVHREALLKLRNDTVAVLSAKDKTYQLSDKLLAAPSASALQGLRARYGEFHKRELAQTSRYRLILVVYTLALLVAFGLIGLRLRHSLGALDQANAELLHTNANLEKTVESRTVDLRKALDDVKLKQAQLVQSEKMASLGQMVAGVAHEINTPLGYATSNVSLVRENLAGLAANPDPDAVNDFSALLVDAEHGLAQISDLVMSLKNFSRVDRSRNELFNVNDGLDTALKICHSQIKDRIEVRREYGEIPLIACAPSQLNQVFLNLLTNAGQAIDGPGQISIRTRDAGEQVEISIKDSGCGMDANTQAHIFEPFYTTKDVGKGTGLGLTIAYRIIEDHKGDITVKSVPGAGTEFIISLPKPRKGAAKVTGTAVTV